MLCFFIFPGSDPLIFFECPDKIAQIVETISICDLRDDRPVRSAGDSDNPLESDVSSRKRNDRSISVTWIQRQKAAAVSVEKHNCAR